MHGEWGRSHSGYLKELVEAGLRSVEPLREIMADDQLRSEMGHPDNKPIATHFKTSRQEIELKVLVTGATAGFGAAIVRRFAADGHRIVAMGRRNNRLEALANEFGLACIHPVVLDVRDRTAVKQRSEACRRTLLNSTCSSTTQALRLVSTPPRMLISTPGMRWSILTSRA